MLGRHIFATNYRHLQRLYSSNTRAALESLSLKDGRKPSYYHGNCTIKLLGMTMGQIIDSTPDRFGDVEAMVDRDNGVRKTFVQFKKEVDEIAMGLLALNLKRGDLIGIWSPNRYEWALTQMATAKIGLILATINPAFKHTEFEYILQKLQMKAIVMAESVKSQNFYEVITSVVPSIKDAKPGHKIKSEKHPYFTDLIMITNKDFPGAFKFKDLHSAGGSNEKRRMEQLADQIQIDDALNLQFTSGTTGKPKAATLPHFGIVNNCHMISDSLGYYEEQHRIALSVPLFHCFGCVAGTFTTMLSGATCVFPAPLFDAGQILKAIEEEKCTSIYGTPTMLNDIINHPNISKTVLSSLKTGLVAGASISPELFVKVHQTLKAPGFQIGYGSTELCPLVTVQHHSESVERKKNNVGRVGPNTEIKIVDTENRVVPVGSPGEICCRGFQVMKGYWNEPDKTKEVIIDGWYHTGDIGTLTEDGRVSVIGRIKDLIIRGGENIYPKEIEDFLLTHPKIFDAQVVGVKDERMGEEVCVWIQLNDNETMDEAELKGFCKGKIAHFKIPRYIRFVKEFPKTVSGKIQKFLIRDEMNRTLGDES